MSKYALISDIHFGVYAFDIRWMDMQINYFSTFFKDTLIKNDVKKVYILGDLLDNRKTLSIILESRLRDLFKETLKDFDFVHVLGNHDVRYKDTNEVHSLGFLEDLPNYSVVSESTLENDIALVPWIHNKTTIEQELSSIDTSKSDYCFGHFELNGFKLNKNKTVDFGHQEQVSLKDYNFKIVFTGHYHTRSHSTKLGFIIQYCGSPFAFTRIDVGDEKGFILLDSESGDYNFVDSEGIFRFIKFDYEEDNLDLEYVKSIFNNAFVDIHVTNASLISEKWDLFRKDIAEFGMINLSIIPKIEGAVDIKEELIAKSETMDVAIPMYTDALDMGDSQKDKILMLLNEIKEDEILSN